MGLSRDPRTWTFTVDGRGIAYGLATFAITLIHNVFLLYHVDVFVTHYGIGQSAFYWSQLVFLVWNSVNDAVFGWLSDASQLDDDASQARVTKETLRRRLRVIGVGGPLYAASFMLFWVPWGAPGLQFITCLCLYDGFLTWVDLNHKALLADLAVEVNERAKLSGHASAFSAVACASVFLSYPFRAAPTLFPFRVFCAVLAGLSAACFVVSAGFLAMQIDKGPRRTGALVSFLRREEHSDTRFSNAPTPSRRSQAAGGNAATGARALVKYVRDVLGYRNLWLFGLMNLIQTFHCHFNSNFFPLFLRHLAGGPGGFGRAFAGFLLGLSFVMPHANNIAFAGVAARVGVYAVVRALFVAKLALAALMLFLPGASPASSSALLAVFVVSNRVFTEGTCRLLGLVVGDIVDEDFVIHRRRQAVSALIYGTTNLLSKAGQTLAPVLGTLFISASTTSGLFAGAGRAGDEVVQLAHVVAGEAVEGGPADGEFGGEMRDALYWMLVLVSVACGVSQLVVWARFTLHGSYLKKIKDRIADMQKDEAIA